MLLCILESCVSESSADLEQPKAEDDDRENRFVSRAKISLSGFSFADTTLHVQFILSTREVPRECCLCDLEQTLVVVFVI